MTRWGRGGAFLGVLATAFVALVYAHDVAQPPAWRGLAILALSLPLFRILNRFERPRS